MAPVANYRVHDYKDLLLFSNKVLLPLHSFGSLSCACPSRNTMTLHLSLPRNNKSGKMTKQMNSTYETK